MFPTKRWESTPSLFPSLPSFISLSPLPPSPVFGDRVWMGALDWIKFRHGPDSSTVFQWTPQKGFGTCPSVFQHLHFDALVCYFIQSVVEQTLLHSWFCSVGATVCHQPHETWRAVGFIVFFGPWYPSFFVPSWPVAERFLSASSTCICVLRRRGSFIPHGFSQFIPWRPHPLHPPHRPFFFFLSTVLSPSGLQLETITWQQLLLLRS